MAPLGALRRPAESAASSRRRVIGVALVVVSLIVIDLWVDSQSGGSLGHLVSEAIIMGMLLWGGGLLWQERASAQQKADQWSEKYAQVLAQADDLRRQNEQWRTESEAWRKGLRGTIDAQFTRWGLSSAESEVAILLLKGLSLKEVAEARQTSERTARQQALAVYRKAGLSGRAELAAFFLEDLFATDAAPD